jgi:hypothetical protein
MKVFSTCSVEWNMVFFVFMTVLLNDVQVEKGNVEKQLRSVLQKNLDIVLDRPAPWSRKKSSPSRLSQHDLMNRGD